MYVNQIAMQNRDCRIKQCLPHRSFRAKAASIEFFDHLAIVQA